ncbi:MAG: hypothetical protein EXQ86_07205 [Rhodospirillales bacterium]|nr:hypothetical protein [Rhodospirillales bacterium]
MVARHLHALIRLNQWEVDEKRRVLGAFVRRLDELEGQAGQLETQLLREQEAARAQPNEAGFLYGNFAQAVIRARERLAGMIASANSEMEAAREALAEARRELKKYEVAQAARDRRAAEEAAKEERVDLDEIGIQGHQRRKTG